MNSVVLFQGQGKYKTKYAKSLIEKNQELKSIWEQASQILNMNLQELLYKTEDAGELQTDKAQPLIFMMEYTAWHIFKDTMYEAPMYLAGHSLGEYMALVASESVSFEDAVKLVGARGRIMQQEGSVIEQGMLALQGCSYQHADKLCMKAEKATGCKIYCANYNSFDQIIVAGNMVAISYLVDHSDVFTRKLAVSRAFHTPFMRESAEQYKEVLQTVNFLMPKIPVISNVTGYPYQAAWTIPDLLYRQIFLPVRWNDIMMYLKQKGVTVYLQVNPNNLFRNMSFGYNEYAQWGWLEEVSLKKIKDYDKAYRNKENRQIYLNEFCGDIMKRMLAFPWRKVSEEKMQQAMVEYRQVEEIVKKAEISIEDVKLCVNKLQNLLSLKGYSVEVIERESVSVCEKYGIFDIK